MESTGQSLIEKTTEVLNKLPVEVSPETQVMVNLIKLLLEEVSNSELGSLKGLIAVQKKVTDNLEKENNRLRERLDSLEDHVDEMEQHGRNVNLILKGIPEAVADERNREQREDTTKKFVEALNQHLGNENKLSPADIARSHRLGKPRGQGANPRPIIARFALETKKMDIFRSKRKLKGKGISLAENLTASRAALYQEACKQMDYKNVWTWEGRIFAKIGTRKKQITAYTDIPGYVPETDADDSEEE